MIATYALCSQTYRAKVPFPIGSITIVEISWKSNKQYTFKPSIFVGRVVLVPLYIDAKYVLVLDIR